MTAGPRALIPGLVLVLLSACSTPGGSASAGPSNSSGASAAATANGLPATGRIAFNLEWGGPNGDDNKNIYTIEPNGTGLLQVTSRTEGADADPTWTPSGDRIIYVSDDHIVSNVISIAPDGSDLQPLTDLGNFAFAPSVSPDGSRIIFARHGDFPAQLWVMNADGTNLIQLTNPPTPNPDGDGDGYPEFSPDGTRLVFTRDAVITVMNLDGSGLTSLTDTFHEPRYPHWSPDGTTILFSSAGQIYTVKPDGTGLTDLVDGDDADWSPDGTMIVFHGFVEGTQHHTLFVANADGSNPIAIYHSPESQDIFIAAAAWGTAP